MIHPLNSNSSISWWINYLRSEFKNNLSSLLPLFETYATEAVFGRRYIAKDLQKLSADAKILEIGAGSLLLSCQLVREGFKITALEPIGPGFSHFEVMRELVVQKAIELDCLPDNLSCHAEELNKENCFDYAFSINVMEHVADVEKVLEKTSNSLKDGSIYRFTAPNYLFPYEPHFNIPTLLSKRLTELLFRKKIYSSNHSSDAKAEWQSLNWINVIQIRNIVRKLSGIEATFSKSFLLQAVERTLSDPMFRSRRSTVVCTLISLIVRLKIHPLLRFVPPELQPVMDCMVRKNNLHRNSHD